MTRYTISLIFFVMWMSLMTIAVKKKPKRAKDVFRNVPVTNIDYNYTQLHTTTQIQARLIIASLSIYTFLALIILEDSCNIIGSKKQLMQLQTNTFNSNLGSYRQGRASNISSTLKISKFKELATCEEVHLFYINIKIICCICSPTRRTTLTTTHKSTSF